MALSAAARVFGITELEEHILTHLELGNLPIIDNISHAMRNLIATSKKLQRTLTLEIGRTVYQDDITLAGLGRHQPRSPYLTFAHPTP